MKRWPVAAFVALAIATIAAFFVTQHLKVSTPLLTGAPAPQPSAINPVNGRACLTHTHRGLRLVSHRRMTVSFYLLNRSDDVDVYIVNQDGDVIKTLASGVHMQASPPKRGYFSWDGRTDSGAIAPDGTYYIKVSLIHQARSVLISNSSGAEPVTLLTVPPRPRITSVTPSAITGGSGGTGATIHYTGADGLQGRIFVYRIGGVGSPQPVKSFAAGRSGSSVWDGTAPGSRPAPPGTYAFRLQVTDKACNVGFYPAQWPPATGTVRGDTVTVR